MLFYHLTKVNDGNGKAKGKKGLTLALLYWKLQTPLLWVNRLTNVHLKMLFFKHFCYIISASQVWATLFPACQLGRWAGCFLWSYCLSFCTFVGDLLYVSPMVIISGYKQDEAIRVLLAISYKCPCLGLWLLRQGPFTGKRIGFLCIQAHPCSDETKLILAKLI